MLFNSFEFFLFLPIVLMLYWSLKRDFKKQNIILLAASYFFYGWWDIRFLFLIATTTVVDYNAALIIQYGMTTFKQRVLSIIFLVVSAILFGLINWQNEVSWGIVQNGILVFTFLLSVLIYLLPLIVDWFKVISRDKIALSLSIISNLTILGCFKYFNFFVDSFSNLSLLLFGIEPSVITLTIILPVGISFYTFQSMSYSIDVYRGQLKASKSLFDYAAYLSFFPQLVAGPIERGKTFLPQFQRIRNIENGGVKLGLWLIAFGLFKKIVIADNLSIFVNTVFSPYDNGELITTPENGLMVLLAIYAFAFQIYADFSGYADIARGTAKLFGFQLMINFRLPYIATNPSDFWRRWHISLSSWLRDYLYIPLGGSRGGTFKTYRNLFLTMLLGGLWHGASITFVLWGAYQGTILILYRLFGVESAGEQSKPVMKVLHVIWMFHLVCLGWLIFRAQNVQTIYLFLEAIFTNLFIDQAVIDGVSILTFYLIPLLVYQILQIKYKTLYPQKVMAAIPNFHIWFFTIMSILALSSKLSSEFIYFAF
ncbi:MBOAT family protein [Moritella sp. 36]|uniref:MBOAT family O-acyltransferase n=1 Tax=Moritella sp. 36 TaxID=2746233 RepID=UPI001BACD28F|nr:MBOAT family O-acyltransferase [Moritella sp. 36]QUM89573.1 MBOAT family protein [Moritella sp. 36]